MPSLDHSPANRCEVESVLRCETARDSPLFLPAIYEHKGSFIGETPSGISRDADLLARAMLAEHEAVQPDALTVGVDVYNVEAEAVGCSVTFYGGGDTSIPGISPGDHIVTLDEDISRRPVPNPLRDGRMPVNIEAAKKVVQALGSDCWVRGSISGPFSLAISLVGAESLFLGCLDKPEGVKKLLGYCARVITQFGQAYIDVGAELVMFDSQTSPDLLPPAMYEEFVLPVTQDLIRHFADKGAKDVPLIIGGNTTPIIHSLLASGANNLLCDFTSGWSEWKEACRTAGRAVRRNISPSLIETGEPDTIYDAALQELENGRDLPGFIMGTAVIPYGTPTRNLLAIRQACLDAGQ